MDSTTPTTAEVSKAVTHAKIALVGNANSGKTSLFNTLTGLRAKTANISGTTVEVRRGTVDLPVLSGDVEIVDLPGTSTLTSLRPDEQTAVDVILGRGSDSSGPDVLVLVIDATQLQRHLYLAGEVLELGIPTLVCLNMSDIAERGGLKIDVEKLSGHLNCPVIETVAHKAASKTAVLEHVESLLSGNEEAYRPTIPIQLLSKDGSECTPRARHTWAEMVYREVVEHPGMVGELSGKVDRIMTHPILGLPAFALVMAGVFYLIFSMASLPMDLIDGFFGSLAEWSASQLGEGAFSSFISDGIIAGVGGTLVFLPQICLLFFVITLLEGSGYLSRAAMVMDRVLRKVGLPGQAFVPMLTSHACAIPGIMACRTIASRKDRLATILVLPLITCGARLPVYAMVAVFLFPGNELGQALLFFGSYILGIVAAVSMAGVFRLTILRGEQEPTVIELPTYKWPSLRNALLTTLDRAWIFTKKAGTVILAIVVVLWWLSSYPGLPETPEVEARVAQVAQANDIEIEQAQGRLAVEYSYAGRAGKLVEPVIRPLGFDWRMGIGVVTSFAAREAVVGTLGVVYGVGEDAIDDPVPLLDKIREATWPDGRPVFTLASSLSFLVFFVLAMQCLPTQAVARRETGSWKWPLLQLGYMTVLAYVGALIVYQSVSALT